MRTYPIPQKLRGEVGLESVSLDQMEALAASGMPLASSWAQRVLWREDQTLVASVVRENELPRGLVCRGGALDNAIVGLVAGSNVWMKDGWKKTCDSDASEFEAMHGEHSEELFDDEDDDEDLIVDYWGTYDEEPELYDSKWDELSYAEHDPSTCPVCKSERYEDDEICSICGRHHETGQKTVDLTEADVAAIIRALTDGANVVIMRPYAPAARLDLPILSSVESDLPSGAVPVAIVDELDRTAVLEVLAVAPGPQVYIRTQGAWAPDDAWQSTLASISPPPMVKLEGALLSSVIAQVDAHDLGSGQPEEVPADEAVQSSSARPEWQRRSDEVALQAALLAASSVVNKAKGAEHLRQYWGYGKGAAKIRWGTKGDWTRCYRHLKKYMGPRAKGYCNLMHARVTGAWSGSKGLNALPNPAVSAEAVAKQLSK